MIFLINMLLYRSMYIEFLPFKNKAFVSLLSLENNKRIYQRELSLIQQKIKQKYFSTSYYIFGRFHREEKENGFVLPAYKYAKNQYRFYYKNNKHHREDKYEGLVLPAIIGSCIEMYKKNGKFHRDDKENGLTLPAVSSIIHQEWWYKGQQHRDDRDENGWLLPANIETDTDKSGQFFLYGIRVSKHYIQN